MTRTNCRAVLRSLHWLPISKRIECKILCLSHNIHRNVFFLAAHLVLSAPFRVQTKHICFRRERNTSKKYSGRPVGRPTVSVDVKQHFNNFSSSARWSQSAEVLLCQTVDPQSRRHCVFSAAAEIVFDFSSLYIVTHRPPGHPWEPVWPSGKASGW